MLSSSPDKQSSLARARAITPGEWRDLAVALFELARARILLARFNARRMLSGVAHSPVAPQASGRDERISRVSKAIARVSHRLPWRADCLIQAVAAQNWLRRYHVPAQIVVGARTRSQEPFEAHAWLTCGNIVVTGGDISGYAPLKPPLG